MAERRSLSFASLDEIMPDVDRLLEGHQTVGNWSLAQICNHLATAIQSSIDGFDVRAPWFMRITLGKMMKRKVFATGKLQTGIKLPDRVLPKPGLDARAEAEALRASLRLFASHTGPVAAHPFFGPMTHAEWCRLHEIHCAHHLSFALPSAQI